ncbi:MAG TPA: hypothetical protein VGI60_12210 [Chthoniobacterales bacterium]
MSSADQLELGYGFALPRMLARLAGKRVRQAQFSALEAYAVCLLIFATHYIFLTRLLIIPLVRPGWSLVLGLSLLPIATWVYLLLLYYAISLVLRIFRKFGLFVSLPNNHFQSVIITALTTLVALLFLGADAFWLKSLGGFWLGLVLLNLLAIAAEKLAHAN